MGACRLQFGWSRPQPGYRQARSRGVRRIDGAAVPCFAHQGRPEDRADRRHELRRPIGLAHGIGSGVRAHLGPLLSPLAIRALLVHCVEGADIPHAEIGWGRLPSHLDDIVVCNDDTVRVVYQGTVTASKYIRAPIPMPDEELKGMVKVRATLCYTTEVDPHHPSNYTRAGLDVVFRPNKTVFKDDEAAHAASKPFFGKNRPQVTEEELRRDAWKWENCLHGEGNFRGRSLDGPVFDIHYNARAEGHGIRQSQELKYALVASVTARRVADLYARIVRRYRGQLEALVPLVEIPVRVQNEDEPE
jgi:hypothetical protein